ncbi:MAG: chemotaxis protein CheA [Acidobacteria bacterium]|nr:chemotaxis protein CheA [Acidobacteriota bacterium]
MIDDKALLSEYLSESEELLDSLLADLDALGANANIHAINRIFRQIHSLKGLSGMMGLAEVQAIAHDFEDILDDIRLGQLKLDKASVAVLQECGASLASLLAGAARGTAKDEDFERLRELLLAIAARPRSQAKREDNDLESLGFSERERQLLTDYEKHRIRENLNAESDFFAIKVQFDITDIDSKYRTLTNQLAEVGELLTTLPDAAKDDHRVAFKLLLSTPLKESEVKQLVARYQGRVARVGRSTWRRAGQALRVVGRKKSRSEEEDKPLSGLLPTSYAQESLQSLSPNVRVDLLKVDELSGIAHELSIEAQKLSAMANRFLNAAGLGARERFDLKSSVRRIEREFLELEERLVELRMVSLAQTFTRAARLAGRLARELGKAVSVKVQGRDTLVDKMIVDRIADPISHLLRNALDHGIEAPQERRLAGKSARGEIKIEARLEGTRALIVIADDGRGINPQEVRQRAIAIGAIAEDESLSEDETLRLIFRPGFSTAEKISSVSGRGVGLNAAERTVYELGGEIRVASQPGQGTTFEIAVPTTLVMISAFIVRAAEWLYAVNVGQIVELIYVNADEIFGRDGKRSIQWRGLAIPLVELKYLLGLGGARVLHQTPSPPHGNGNGYLAATPMPVVISRASDRYAAIAVEQFVEQREIIVKSLGPLGAKMKGIIGAVDLAGGEVALVLDLQSLLLLRSLRL